MKHGVIIGGTHTMNARTKEPFFYLDLCDLDRSAVERIPVKFLAHGFTVDPRRPHVAAIFEKKGPGGAVVDLRQRTVLREVAPKPGCAFYGHGQYAKDGATVFVVETDLTTHRGLITVRDANDFRVLEECPTFGDNPHDCVLLDDGTMVVTNGGGVLDQGDRGCVTIVDLASRKLVERLDIPNDRLNAGHLAVTDAKRLVVSSAPRDGLPAMDSPGGVSFRADASALFAARAEEQVTSRMRSESLSVCVHEPSGIAVVTNPWGDLLTLWNAREGTLIEARTMEFPRGVTLTLDGNHFAITYGKSLTVGLFDVASVAPTGRTMGGAISGSHAYVWDAACAST